MILRHRIDLALLAVLLVGRGLATEPPIIALAMAPDGNSLVTGSQAGVTIRDWPTLKQQRQLETSVLNVHDLAFSPDGRLLAIAGGSPSEQGTVEVLDWNDGSTRFRADGHDDTVMDVTWRDNESIITASLDHEIVDWDLSSSMPARRLRGHSRGVACVVTFSDGAMLASGSIDQNVRIWDLTSGTLSRSLNNHTRAIHELALRPAVDGLPMIASVSDDRTVRLWQPTIGRMVRFVRLESIPLSLAWLPDGSRIVVATSQGQVVVLNPDTVEIEQQVPALDGWAYSIVVHPVDDSVAVGGSDGSVVRVSLP